VGWLRHPLESSGGAAVKTVQMRVKLVLDGEPNADGRWVEVDAPAPPFDVFAWTPLPGYHVVAYEIVRPRDARIDRQDGGPMHAAFLGG
jgi:hypothetical protein